MRREAAIALGRLGDAAPATELYKALDDSDAFAAWSIRQAIRRSGAWQKDELVSALLDERRREPALRLADRGLVDHRRGRARRCVRSIAVGSRARANPGQHRRPAAQISRLERHVVRHQPARRRLPAQDERLGRKPA